MFNGNNPRILAPLDTFKMHTRNVHNRIIILTLEIYKMEYIYGPESLYLFFGLWLSIADHQRSVKNALNQKKKQIALRCLVIYCAQTFNDWKLYQWNDKLHIEI